MARYDVPTLAAGGVLYPLDPHGNRATAAERHCEGSGTAMQTGEFQTLRERALARDPVPLNLYRAACQLERLTPEQAMRVAEGLNVLCELLETADAKGDDGAGRRRGRTHHQGRLLGCVRHDAA